MMQASGDHAARPRLTHLLAVARREFIAHGYQHSSVDGIARAASVSKETIYRYFPDKRALFRAAAEGLQEEFAARLAAVDETADAEDIIGRFALQIYDSAAEGGHLSLIWLTIAIAREFPALADALYRGGVERLEPVRQRLAVIAGARGFDGMVTIDHAAGLGAMAVEGPRHVMGWPALEGADRQRHARATARLFLNGCLAGSGAAVPLARPPDQPAEPPLPAPARGDHIATLMAVARRHFEERGYRGASLDEIGAEARVGRGTLYRHFAGKDGLFESVMLDVATELSMAAVRDLPALDPAEEPAAVLLRFARAVSPVLTSPASIALHRTVIAEARRAPRLARQVYTRVRLGLTLPLTDYLAAGAASGRFVVDDPDWYARQLLTLVAGGNRPLSAASSPDAATRDAIARRAVTTFLYGFGRALD